MNIQFTVLEAGVIDIYVNAESLGPLLHKDRVGKKDQVGVAFERTAYTGTDRTWDFCSSAACAGTCVWLNRNERSGSTPQATSAATIS